MFGLHLREFNNRHRYWEWLTKTGSRGQGSLLSVNRRCNVVLIYRIFLVLFRAWLVIAHFDSASTWVQDENGICRSVLRLFHFVTIAFLHWLLPGCCEFCWFRKILSNCNQKNCISMGVRHIQLRLLHSQNEYCKFNTSSEENRKIS